MSASTAVPGPNKAPIKIISKLSKINRICLYVIIMQHVYPQNRFYAFCTLQTPYKRTFYG